jgi:hypothetical protein
MLNRLQDVFASLNRHNVRYVVMGGIAAVLHGVPRATFDLDLLIVARQRRAVARSAPGGWSRNGCSDNGDRDPRQRNHCVQGSCANRRSDIDAGPRLCRRVDAAHDDVLSRRIVFGRVPRRSHRGQARRRPADRPGGRAAARALRGQVLSPCALCLPSSWRSKPQLPRRRLAASRSRRPAPPRRSTAFVRGVLLLHSFEYDDAIAAFREAEKADPGFAMAYWGEAGRATVIADLGLRNADSDPQHRGQL